MIQNEYDVILNKTQKKNILNQLPFVLFYSQRNIVREYRLHNENVWTMDMSAFIVVGLNMDDSLVSRLLDEIP